MYTSFKYIELCTYTGFFPILYNCISEPSTSCKHFIYKFTADDLIFLAIFTFFASHSHLINIFYLCQFFYRGYFKEPM